MERIILHCDLNNFFASVECLNDPTLKEVPMAVCGSVENRHGIILAKNELAKQFGIKTAEVVWEAKQKCPQLVCVPPHMDWYVAVSERVRAIYQEYTNQTEAFGIDECWLDVTGSTLLFGSGYDIAMTIKERIKAEIGVTISVGVSFNKLFAKLGSDMKKPDGITCITRDNYKEIVWPMQADTLLGIGRSTNEKLLKYGIHTVGDMANADINLMKRMLGKRGQELRDFANGIDDSPVLNQDDYTAPKSVGNSSTTKEDMTTAEEVWKQMYYLADKVSMRLRDSGLLAGGVQVVVKNTNLKSKEYQAPLATHTRHPQELAKVGMALFNQHYNWALNVRLIGITAINLVREDEEEQFNMLVDPDKRNELDCLEDKVYGLRKRYGKGAVKRGSLVERKIDDQVK